MTGSTLTADQLAHIEKTALAVRDRLLHSFDDDLCSALDQQRNVLYRGISICSMVKDSLADVADDNDDAMQRYEAVQTALELLTNAWKGLEDRELCAAAAAIDAKRMEDNYREVAGEA
jgi:hypothetical protein